MKALKAAGFILTGLFLIFAFTYFMVR